MNPQVKPVIPIRDDHITVSHITDSVGLSRGVHAAEAVTHGRSDQMIKISPSQGQTRHPEWMYNGFHFRQE